MRACLRRRVARDLDWFVRGDGSRCAVSWVAAPIETPRAAGSWWCSTTPAVSDTRSGGGAHERRQTCARPSRHGDARVEGGTLHVEVRDDGIGGVRTHGSGLRGLVDRLAVLDGQLRLESPVDGGTLVVVDIPYARRRRRRFSLPTDDRRPARVHHRNRVS
jgi:hypothetical protein